MSVPRTLREVEERLKREIEEQKAEENTKYLNLSSDLERILFDPERYMREWKAMEGNNGDSGGFVVFRNTLRVYEWKNPAKETQL